MFKMVRITIIKRIVLSDYFVLFLTMDIGKEEVLKLTKSVVCGWNTLRYNTVSHIVVRTDK